MSQSVKRGELNDQEVRLKSVLADFERAWRQAKGKDDAPSISSRLPAPTDPGRAAALDALIRADLLARWQRRIFTYLEQYLDQFPELGASADLAASLIVEEYRIRHMFGDQPAVENYSQRFPKQFAEFKKSVQGDGFHTLQAPPQPAAAGEAQRYDVSTAPVADRSRNNDLIPINIGYRLLERIGRGNYGDVWKAENLAGGFEAAVKIIMRPLDHDDVRRELQSLDAIRRVRHPFLLATLAYWPLEDRLIIAMELADSTLNDRLKQCKAQALSGIPVDELLDYFREAAEALDYLHARSVFHRDIKPANILLFGGHVKVGDFGLARLQEENKLMSATFCGTPYYMAPEIWEGKLGSNSDQYSLAVTYVELRLGRLPFTGRNISELALNHQNATPDLSALGPQEGAVILRALSKDPDDRFPTCKEFVVALDQAIRPSRQGAGSNADIDISRRSGTVAPTPGLTTDPFPAHSESPRMTGEALGRQTLTGGRLSGTLVDEVSLPTPIPIKERRAGLLVGIVIGALLLAGLAFYVGPALWPPDPSSPTVASIKMEKPPAVRMSTRGKAMVPVRVKRTDFTKPIVVKFDAEELSKLGLASEPVTLDGNQEVAELKLVPSGTRPELLFGSAGISAVADGVSDENHVDITLIPMPAGCRNTSDKMETDRNGVQYYTEIAYILPDGSELEFLLVPKKEDREPDTFYIMKFKVTVAQFRPFEARAQAMGPVFGMIGVPAMFPATQFRSTTWNRNGRDRQPALQVWGIDAYRFATQWVRGGVLPDRRQWEQAAGKNISPRPKGPYKGVWNPEATPRLRITVDRKEADGPTDVGSAADDESPYGCFDMAGNGEEWTRTDISKNGERTIDDSNLMSATQAYGFGQTYTHNVPFQFDADSVGSTSYYDEPHAIGFRVVIQP